MIKFGRLPTLQTLAVTFAGIVFVAALGWVMFYFPIGNPIARLSYDLPFAWRSNIATPDVRLVVIDENSARALNQPIDAPWDRHLHAQLVNLLTKAGARAILFDLVFDAPSANPKVDDEFAQAIHDNGHVFSGRPGAVYPVDRTMKNNCSRPFRCCATRRRAGDCWCLVRLIPIRASGKFSLAATKSPASPGGWRASSARPCRKHPIPIMSGGSTIISQQD